MDTAGAAASAVYPMRGRALWPAPPLAAGASAGAATAEEEALAAGDASSHLESAHAATTQQFAAGGPEPSLPSVSIHTSSARSPASVLATLASARAAEHQSVAACGSSTNSSSSSNVVVNAADSGRSTPMWHTLRASRDSADAAGTQQWAPAASDAPPVADAGDATVASLLARQPVISDGDDGHDTTVASALATASDVERRMRAIVAGYEQRVKTLLHATPAGTPFPATAAAVVAAAAATAAGSGAALERPLAASSSSPSPLHHERIATAATPPAPSAAPADVAAAVSPSPPQPDRAPHHFDSLDVSLRLSFDAAHVAGDQPPSAAAAFSRDAADGDDSCHDGDEPLTLYAYVPPAPLAHLQPPAAGSMWLQWDQPAASTAIAAPAPPSGSRLHWMAAAPSAPLPSSSALPSYTPRVTMISAGSAVAPLGVRAAAANTRGELPLEDDALGSNGCADSHAALYEPTPLPRPALRLPAGTIMDAGM